MSGSKRSMYLLVCVYAGWLALWCASLNGWIDSRLSQNSVRWICVGIVLICCLTIAQSERIRSKLMTVIRKGQRWYVALCALFVLGVTTFISLESYGGAPRVQDEINYFFMGKIFQSGHLWLDALPANDFLSYRFMVTEEHIYSLFQPGWPTIMALGHLMGVPWLMGPVVSALSTVMLYYVSKELFDQRHALWATIMMSCSQVWWFQGASMMSHMWACLLGLLGIYFALKVLSAKQQKQIYFAALAGAFLGAMFTVRAGTAVALSLPVIVSGAYLLARKKLALKTCVAFGVGLAMLGSCQLLYNYLITGNPVVFPQDHYFNITEPVQKCHRLGLGPGIGCPYEHGPDLVRGGFTWNRAFEVTFIRLSQLKFDLFGTGVALWTGLFAIFSHKYLKQKIFCFALCASVIGLYFFYYYHGNLYGARYYFEITPYLMMFLVSSWISLIGLVNRVRSTRYIWCRRALVAGVIAFPLTLPVYNLVEGAEEKHKKYEGSWRFIKAVEKAEQESTLENAVIIMPNAKRSYWAGFAQNQGDLEGDRIYVRDWGHAMNARLKEYYPDKAFYKPRMNDKKVEFVPVKIPDMHGKIVIEGESLFPISERNQGYAVTQSLKPWPKAHATRQEHLLFERTQKGSWFRFKTYVSTAGQYNMSGKLTSGPDYGMIRFTVNKTQIHDSFDGYDPEVIVKSWHARQPVELQEGWNTITVEVVGKNDESKGFVAGIDQLTLMKK